MLGFVFILIISIFVARSLTETLLVRWRLLPGHPAYGSTRSIALVTLFLGLATSSLTRLVTAAGN